MDKRFNYFESVALNVFFQFCHWKNTNDICTGIQIEPELSTKQIPGKKESGDIRAVTILQGNPDKIHQKLTVFFMYHEDHDWFVFKVEFSGKTSEDEVWSEKYRAGQVVGESFYKFAEWKAPSATPFYAGYYP